MTSVLTDPSMVATPGVLRRATRRLPTALLGLLVLGAGACGGEAALDESSGEVGEASSEAILGADTWDLMPSFRGDEAHHLGTLYGRATGHGFHRNLNGGRDRGCSGFLVGDDVYVTAKHCRRDLGGQTEVTVTFGTYGFADGDFTLAHEEGKRRLVGIGVPWSVVKDLLLPTWTQWVCDLEPEDPDRDISYYRCRNNVASWVEGTGSNAQTINLGLKPGHVWGHYKVATGSRPDGRRVYTNSVNRRCGQTFHNVLLSPGKVEDSSDGCAGPSSNQHCFDVDSDWVRGSSGGAIVDRTTNSVFGVVNGTEYWWLGDPDDPCENWTLAENLGTYIGSRVDTYLNELPNGSGFSLGVWPAYSAPMLGGAGGQLRAFGCPDGQLVAGVVGSTAEDGRVGNLGIICVPHRLLSSHRLDRAVISAGGSLDTNFRVAHDERFDVYLNEALSSTRPAPGTQQIVMCPPGYFVTELQAYWGAVLERVEQIRCEDPQTGKSTHRILSGTMGRIGTRRDGAYGTTSCQPGTYFAGMYERSGWLTDAFQPVCRAED